MKKFLGDFSLTFVFMLFMLIIFTKDSQAATTLSQLQTQYPTGSRWTATYYGLKKVNGGYARVIASECAGFAALMYNRYYDFDPYEYAEETRDINRVSAGDIVRYGNNAHSVWILSRDGDYVQVAECNYDLNCTVRWYQTKSLSELNNGLTYIYKAPYVLDDIKSYYISSRDNQNRVENTVLESGVNYRTHVEEIGWQNYKQNGDTAGTLGASLRLEGIEIKLKDLPESGDILYSTHIQNIGWQDYVKNGKMSGTSGRSLRLEAIKIRLSGEVEKKYDIYYRVHSQNIGWMGWAKNGEIAGTAGFGYRLEAIQIKLVNKNESAPGNMYNSYIENNINYQTHVQNVGWQNYVKSGEMSGTSGQSLRLEGIKIILPNQEVSGNIEYSTHVQNIGWQNYVKNGEMSGTSGQSLRLEAIKIRLTGDMQKQYDIYYRVHSQNIGWMGWAKNGESAGTAGFGYRLEGIQIELVKKGESVPGDCYNSFIQK